MSNVDNDKSGSIYLDDPDDSLDSNFLLNRKLLMKDYEGLDVLFTDDLWFDATSVGKRFGRKPYNWLDLQSTKDYLADLVDVEGNNPNPGILCSLPSVHDFVQTEKGGNNRGRTWFHWKLIGPYARWLNVRFSIWCDSFVSDLLLKRGSLSLDYFLNGIIPLLRLSTIHRERFLYVMRETLTGVYKFGLSINPSRRLYEFHVGNHSPLELIAIYPVKDKGKEELSLLRSYFQNYKVPGSVDWYDLDSFFNTGKEPSPTTLDELVISLSYSDKFSTDSILSLSSAPKVLSLTSPSH